MTNFEKLMSNLPKGMDACLITSDVNRRYYTGFQSSAGTVVVTKDESYLIIDSRYFEAASKKSIGCKVLLQNKLYEQIMELLKKHNVKTVGVESNTMTIANLADLKSKLSSFDISSDKELSEFIEAQRAVKSQWEIDNIQAAQDNTDQTFTHILSFIKQGMTEIEIALEMEFFSRKNGSEEPAFSFIVAAGKNSSMPHAVPSDNIVKKGDFLTMDFGSTINGYRSDMTRTIAIGEVSEKQKEVYNTVLKAQLESMKIIKSGVNCSDVDKVARDIIYSAGYEGMFGHGLGHSLGLEIHEEPRFSMICSKSAMVDNVMSVEPGIYIPNQFGVRIEDIVVVTEDGYHNFTKSKKELIVI